MGGLDQAFRAATTPGHLPDSSSNDAYPFIDRSSEIWNFAVTERFSAIRCSSPLLP
jgi:hypothetical protein